MDSGGYKQVLNRHATRALLTLGYSDARASDAKREAWWWVQARIGALKRFSGVVSGRAVVWTGPGTAELVHWDTPVAGPGEVTVELLATAVNPGTERAHFLRLPNTEVAFPSVPGYSGAGLVLHAGRGDTGVLTGDLVAVAGAPHASVLTVPASRVVRVPEGVSERAAATAYLGVIGLHGVEVAAVEPAVSVVVVGAGMIGLLAARIAAARGADVVVVARTRRGEAAATGDQRVRFALVGDALGTLRADVVIEATGDPEAVRDAIELANPGARIVLLGSSRGTTSRLPIELIQSRRLELVGAHVGTLQQERGSSGDDPVAERMRTFLELLAEGLAVDDLLEHVDPREASLFYRSLQRPGGRPGALFEWTLLPRAERASRATMLRPPRLRAAGVEPEAKPARGPRRRSISNRPAGDTDGAPLRFGLLGCGDIGSVNADAIGATGSARLVACYDAVPSLAEDVAHRHGAEVARSAEEMMERPDIDAVFICVPHHLHAPLALQAIAAGRHVVVEKPLAVDLESAGEIVRAARRAGIVLSTCFPHRHDPAVERAHALVDEGALGNLGGAFVSFFADKPPTYWSGGYSGRSFSSWRLSRAQAGGGILIMNLPHYLDLVRHVSGLEAESVIAVVGGDADLADVEDTINLSIRYEGGAVGAFFATASARGIPGPVELRMWGADGTLILEPVPQVFTLRVTSAMQTSRWVRLERPTVDFRACYVERFVEALRTGSTPPVTAHDGLAVQAIIEAAYRSAATGSQVEVAPLLGEVIAQPGEVLARS